MVEADACIFLSGESGEKLPIRNVNGSLVVQVLPTAHHDPAEHTPDAIIQRLSEVPPHAITASPAEASLLMSEAPPSVAKRRRWRESPWLLAAVLVLATIVAYGLCRRTLPEGTALIRDARQLTTLPARLKGQYGALGSPGAEVVVLERGRITLHAAGAAGPTGEPLMDRTYRLAERDGQVIILVDNGAVFERDPARGAAFRRGALPPARRGALARRAQFQLPIAGQYLALTAP